MTHPAARLGLARVLLAGHPKMTAEQAVSNATQIIEGLHQLGLQVGPVACFGPQELTRAAISFDAIGEIADLIEEEAGRRPWLPES
jgi:hypothetical protein